jgi:glucose/arabinose dehydrogenase
MLTTTRPRGRRRARLGLAATGVALLALSGCYRVRNAEGGGEVDVDEVKGPRPIRTTDVALHPGFGIRLVAHGLTYPTGIAFDERGQAFVIESGYSYGEEQGTARLLQLDPAGGAAHRVIATSANGPWNGVAYHQGSFFVAEGGAVANDGKILRISPQGQITVLVEGLPSGGDHHTNGPAIGPDGHVYFGQGTVTNSGVVGPDSAEFGWLKRHPQLHDIPCKDIKHTGQSIESKNVLAPDQPDVKTSPYAPFGKVVEQNAVVAGKIPCSGAILKVPATGGPPQLVAWGLRNPFGLAFAPDGTLFVTDNGFDSRGSRPVWGGPDVLWKIEPGAWYGWPDYSAGESVVKPRFKYPGKPQPQPVLAEFPQKPPQPVVRFGAHSSSNTLDISRNEKFGFVGHAFVPQFGDMTPATGQVSTPVGFKVVRVDVQGGFIEDFAVNKGPGPGPASLLEHGGLERPVAVRFDPAGTALYVVDFGVMATTEEGPKPQKGTGVVWRISHRGAR